MDYAKRREAIYGPIRAEGIFTWDWMYDNEYALSSMYGISEQLKKELAYASEQLGKIFAKTTNIIQSGDHQLFIELGIPQPVIAAARIPVLLEMPTLIGRFDFAKTTEGLKMLEFNSDTPGGIVESYYVNGQVCAYYGLENPNHGLESDITAAFQDMLTSYARLGYATDSVVFSALDWHAEDAGTARYLMNLAKLKAKFVPLKDLRLLNNRLYSLLNEKLEVIDVLYRLHPLGVLSTETDTDGFPTGEYVLKLIADGNLAIINPPGAIISQSKALQALIWNVCQTTNFFNQEEREIITCYMLPTYLENQFLHKCPYVIKPVLGREGIGISLHHADGTLAQCTANTFQDQAVVYQKKVELEVAEVETLTGPYRGHLLWGSFLINGKASAVSARIGESITDDLSYFLPIHLT